MPDFTQYACPVCGQKFHASDDVVVCPQCGAPHHRTCWKEEGRCHFQSAHGTSSQWKPLPDKEDDNAVVCGNCGTVNSDGRTCCQKCGHELYPAVEEDREDPPLTPPSPFPTLFSQPSPPLEDQVGGIKTADLNTFVGKKSASYVGKFWAMEKQHTRLSWNWVAAIAPLTFLAYRKMYRWFWLYLALTLLLLSPALTVIVLSYAQLASPEAYSAFQQTGLLPVVELPLWLNILYSMVSPALFLIRMLLACFGNSLYRDQVFRRIRQAQKQNADPLIYRYILAKKGGVSVLSVIALYLGIIAGLVLFCLLLAFFIPL